MPHSDAPKNGWVMQVAPSHHGLVRAAVVVPIFRHLKVWRLLLIRRGDTLAHHRGQYAFPGGRWEPSDKNLWHTARREAQEELGWDPAEMELLAVLPTQETATSGFCISPFLIRLPWPLLVVPQRSEVAGVIAPPLAFFAENHSQVSRLAVKNGLPCYTYQSCLIWGATARIIHGLMAGGLTRDSAGRVP